MEYLAEWPAPDDFNVDQSVKWSVDEKDKKPNQRGTGKEGKENALDNQ